MKRQKSKAGVSIFMIKANYAVSVSLLLNDIDAFANNHSAFRLDHPEFFMLTEQEI